MGGRELAVRSSYTKFQEGRNNPYREIKLRRLCRLFVYMEDKAGGSGLLGQPGLYSETLSKEIKGRNEGRERKEGGEKTESKEKSSLSILEL